MRYAATCLYLGFSLFSAISLADGLPDNVGVGTELKFSSDLIFDVCKDDAKSSCSRVEQKNVNPKIICTFRANGANFRRLDTSKGTRTMTITQVKRWDDSDGNVVSATLTVDQVKQPVSISFSCASRQTFGTSFSEYLNLPLAKSNLSNFEEFKFGKINLIEIIKSPQPQPPTSSTSSQGADGKF